MMKVLITGGTHGMGKGLAKILAGIDKQAHEIIILCRSRELGEALIEELIQTTSNQKTSIIVCDLSKLSEVKHAIREIHEKHTFLDGIFINAGLGYAAKRIETEDGFDSHFQVNYLSQFMLTLNLLDLLEKSEKGGRIIFNVTRMGTIFWEDLQMQKKWSYEAGIHQAMVAKRMFLTKLHHLYGERQDSKLSFIGFEIPKIVWSHQLNIIPLPMKIMAGMMRLFGSFISIEQSGQIMAPLFTESQVESQRKSGQLMSWKKNEFIEIKEGEAVLHQENLDRLWKISLDLCGDPQTHQLAAALENH